MTTVQIDQRLQGELSEDLQAAARASGCEILEASFAGDRLRIVLEHPEGTTLTHCEEVSKRVSALLDALDVSDRRYVLEVSSPGLDRKLYGPTDYQRFQGRRARVTWVDADRGKRTDVGRLGGETTPDARGESLRLTLDDGTALAIPIGDVAEARLEIDI